MAWAEGIRTREVSVGRAFTIERGAGKSIGLSVESERAVLVWAETGDRYVREKAAAVAGSGAAATVTVPVTDQDGWMDGEGHTIDVSEPGSYTHRYIAKIWLVDSRGRPVPGTTVERAFILPTFEEPLDLDRESDAGTVPGDLYPIPPAWIEAIADIDGKVAQAEAARDEAEAIAAAPEGIRDNANRAEAAQTAAETAQQGAEDSAQAAAGSAADAAAQVAVVESAADDVLAELEAVEATNDGIMASVAADPESQFSGQLTASVSERVPPAVADVIANDSTVVDAAAAKAQSDAGLVRSEWIEETRVEFVPEDDPDSPIVAFGPLDHSTGWRWAFAYEDGEVALGQRTDGRLFPEMQAPGSSTPGVVIHGDSLTAGWASHASDLGESLGRSVLAVGNGGHASYWVAGRQGGEPFLVTVDGGGVPATGGVGVTLAFAPIIGTTGASAAPSATGSYTGVLAGVAGTIQITGAGVGTFTRSSAGRPVPVPNGSRFVTGLAYRERWPILWAGRNNFKQTQDGDQVVKDIRAMLAWSRHADHALVLSIPPWVGEEAGTGVRATLDGVNAQLATEFPTAFEDTAARLRSTALLESLGLTVTAQDETDIANGLTPSSLREDAGHLNTDGYRGLNLLIEEIYVSRGWSL